MDFPIQIQFRDIEESDFIYNDIYQHVEKLQRFHERIVSCHVTISAPHRHSHKGHIYHVQIRMHVPGGDVFVNTDSENNRAHEDAYVAIRDAFEAARRQLEDFTDQQRGHTKNKSEKAVYPKRENPV